MPSLAGFLESSKMPWFSLFDRAMWLARSRFLDQELNLGPESQPRGHQGTPKCADGNFSLKRLEVPDGAGRKQVP